MSHCEPCILFVMPHELIRNEVAIATSYLKSPTPVGGGRQPHGGPWGWLARRGVEGLRAEVVTFAL
jgi:hypothetical protein